MAARSDLQLMELVHIGYIAGDEVPLLIGTKNWRKWVHMLSASIIGESDNHWKLIIGERKEPKTLSIDEAQTLLPEFQKGINLQAKEDVMAVTAEDVQRYRLIQQTEWRLANNQCFKWIVKKLGPNMMRYSYGVHLAPELYAKLKNICESNNQQSRANALGALMNFEYRGVRPVEFLLNWKLSLQEYEDMMDAGEGLGAATIINMFLCSVGRVPGTTPWLLSYNLDLKKTSEQNLEDLYDSFSAAEVRRLSILGCGQNRRRTA